MIALIVFMSAVLLTWVIRGIARKRGVMDIPNARSSHTVATPRGGGLAIILAFFPVLAYLYAIRVIEAPLFFALLCALPIVVVSLIDDIVTLSARVRFGVQILSAAAALYALGGPVEMNFGLFRLEGIGAYLVAFLMIVWYTNLYNFLDGIDGYAGSEAVFAGLAGYMLFGSETGLLLAAATAGFLVFNWHKASIFMGDVGSAPLGFLFAVLALHDAASPAFLGWVVLLSLFWFDATVTLWRRWRNRERLSQAHRKHGYQRLTQSGVPHDRVVMMGMGLNTVLFAMLCLAGPDVYWVVFLAAVALLWFAMKYVDRKKAFS
jgi:Fuc2NAc and GlcNAc transferase